MTFSAWLNYEISQTNLLVVIFCSLLCTVAFLAVRVWSGSPYQMMLSLGISDLVPPVWLMTVLRFLSFLTAGAAAGIVLGWKVCGCDGEKYRGGMFFILLIMLELLWYPALFRAGLVFLATVQTLLILALGVCVTMSFSKISRLATLIMVLHDVWLSYLLILTCAIFFRN